MMATYTVMPEAQHVAATYDLLRTTPSSGYDRGWLMGRTVQAALDYLTRHTSPNNPEALADVLHERAAVAISEDVTAVTWTELVADLRHTHDHLIHGEARREPELVDISCTVCGLDLGIEPPQDDPTCTACSDSF